MADNGERPIRVLSLDGGGVRGLSAILIIDHIMRTINTQRKADGKEPQEPWQYFDLMGGTSTGGIIAIMLGRLRMTISECIEAYTELSKAIFTPRHSRSNPVRGVEYLNGDGKFDSLFLEKEIKTQIRKSKLGEDDDQILLQDPGSPCKVCVFALRESNSKLAILRSYDYLHASQTLFEECKVWEACRATSAAPTFFDPVQIGPFKQRFIDGGLGYNNPVFKVYDEAQNIWPDRTIVATSIGTGEVPGTAFGGNLKRIAESITKIVTGCDVVADDFYNANKDMVAEERYFRLSVIHGLGNIGLEEHKHIGEIVDQTQEYLSRGEPQTKLKKCIKALQQELTDNDPRRLPGHTDFKSDACLESLRFKEMNFREENIVIANDDTCDWLLENENYARWIQDDDGILWIQGKAGAGKSTLMKYIYEKIQTSTADAPVLKLSFFFHARGTELQKTSLGMFKSLLLQLYKGDSTARTAIRKEFNKNSEDGMVEVKWEWTERMLETLFSKLICQISQSKRVMIFVDALDEAGEAVANDLATYLVGLYEKVQERNGTVKVCFSSRHHPIVSTNLADNQKVIVEHENRRGIQSFLENKFKEYFQGRGLIGSEETDWSELKDDISAKANGLFQWVCLVLPIIFRAYRNAEPLRSIKKKLDGLPEGLDEMYRYIFQDLISHKKQHTSVIKLFRWVCFAARPLSVEELRHAMAVNDAPPPLQVYKLEDSSEYVEHRMETRILALSGGLIEVRKHDSGTVAQVNHQTVREFLLEEGFEILTGLELSSDTEKKQFEGSCHNILARSCVNYLWTEGVQRHSRTTGNIESSTERIWIKLPTLEILESLPLLQYAVAALFWHASKAEQNGHSQDRLLEQFGYKYTRRIFQDTLKQGLFSLWCSAGMIFCPRDYFGVLPSHGSTLLQIASMANIQSVVKIIIGKGIKVAERDEVGQQAIHYAARGGAMEVSKVLMKSSRSIIINAEDNYSVTPLQMAARHYKGDVVRLLITKGAKIKCLNEENSTKLEEVRGDVEKTISLLLEDAEKFNAQSLQSAAASGYLSGVRLLLAEGTDVNSRGGRYGSALIAAVYNNHNDVAEALLQNGAEINSIGGEYGCALAVAVQIDNEDMVNNLLSWGADTNVISGPYGNVLIAAAHKGHTKMVELLLEMGADINAKGGEYGNVLVASSSNGKETVVKILLEWMKRDAPINIQSEEFGDALLAAVCNGHVEVVKILIDEGANINAQIGKYGNALMAAVLSRQMEVTMLLLQGGAEINALNGEHTNALALAARGGDLDLVELLLEVKAEYDPFVAAMIDFDQDGIVRSLEAVLLVASYWGRLDIIERILAFNEHEYRPQNTPADIASRILSRGRLDATRCKDYWEIYGGFTALQLAAMSHKSEVVSRLLAAGANVEDAPAAEHGRTALQAAAFSGHISTIEILLKAGANVNAHAAKALGFTALHAAAWMGSIAIVERLIAAGANINATNDDGSSGGSALGAAAGEGHYQIVELLLSFKADPNVKGPLSPLQQAAKEGYFDIVKVLLDAGANGDFSGSGYEAEAIRKARSYPIPRNKRPLTSLEQLIHDDSFVTYDARYG